MQQFYNKDRDFDETFESNRYRHLADYVEKCEHWDVTEEDKFLFFRYSLADGLDVMNYYESLVVSLRETGVTLRWNKICDPFASQFTSIIKQTEISNRLHAIKLEKF